MKAPETLRQLLRTAAVPLWKGLAYERTAVRNVEEFIDIVGDLDIDQVNTVVMDKYRAALTVSEATVNRKLTNVHSLLQYAVDREWLVKMPKIVWNAEPEGRVCWLSQEDEAKMFSLLAQWNEVEVSRFLRVLIETGVRRSELLTATQAQVDGQWLRLWKTKTKKARSVPLSEAARDALAQGLPWKLDENKLRQVWDRLRKEMGRTEDETFVLHMLRHTCATRALRKTKNLRLVQVLLGHSKITTTTRYAHIADDELLAAVA